MKCTFCEATGTLKRVRGRTPTGHELSVPVCAACRDQQSDTISAARETRRARRALVELVRGSAGKRRRKRVNRKLKRGTKCQPNVDRVRRHRAQRVLDDATAALEE